MVEKTKNTAKRIKSSLTDTTSSIIDEIDKAKVIVVREIQEGFDVVKKKAKNAGQTTADAKDAITEKASDAKNSVKDTISDVHPTQMFQKLMDEVEEIAEGIIKGISTKFTQLRKTAVSKTTKKPEKKKVAPKKAVAKKKAATKKAAVKKAVVKKKAAEKKKVTAKKATVKKKAASKKVVKKKTSTKKSVSGK